MPEKNNKLKQIPDFPNYAVTKDGQVWGKKRKKWLKSINHHSNHPTVSLYDNGKIHTTHIHVAVLTAFVGRCPKEMECRHLDGNPKNNNLNNLKWGTRKENIQDSIKHGTHHTFDVEGEKHPNAKLTEQDVRMIVYMWRTKLFEQKEIAKIYNVDQAHISHIINKDTWKHIWSN